MKYVRLLLLTGLLVGCAPGEVEPAVAPLLSEPAQGQIALPTKVLPPTATVFSTHVSPNPTRPSPTPVLPTPIGSATGPTPSPIETADRTVWRTIEGYFDIAFRAPQAWEVSFVDNMLYLDSMIRYGGEPRPLSYTVFVSEFPNPNNLSFAEAVTAGLINGYGIETYETYLMGEKETYWTTTVPSAEGALTVFLTDHGRFLSFSLMPFGDVTPFAHQETYLDIFRSMLESVNLDGVAV